MSSEQFDSLTDWALVSADEYTNIIDLVCNAFGGLDQQKVTYMLKKTVNSSVLDLQGIGLAVGHYGPAAFAVGYKLGDCLILHSIMAQYNVMPWQAGECIKWLILRLYESPIGEKHLERLGKWHLLDWVAHYRAEYQEMESQHSRWAYVQTLATFDAANPVAVLMVASEFDARRDWFKVIGL